MIRKVTFLVIIRGHSEGIRGRSKNEPKIKPDAVRNKRVPIWKSQIFFSTNFPAKVEVRNHVCTIFGDVSFISSDQFVSTFSRLTSIDVVFKCLQNAT